MIRRSIYLLLPLILAGCSPIRSTNPDGLSIASVDFSEIQSETVKIQIKSERDHKILLENCSPYLKYIIMKDGAKKYARFGPTCVLLPRTASLGKTPMTLSISDVPDYPEAVYVFEIVYRDSVDSPQITKQIEVERK